MNHVLGILLTVLWVIEHANPVTKHPGEDITLNSVIHFRTFPSWLLLITQKFSELSHLGKYMQYTHILPTHVIWYSFSVFLNLHQDNHQFK